MQLCESINYSFLIAGHTKFGPDHSFGMIKRAYKMNFISSLYEFADIWDGSSLTGVNKAQPVGTHDGRNIVPAYNWSSLLENYFIKLPNIKDKYCVTGQFNRARSHHDFLLGESWFKSYILFIGHVIKHQRIDGWKKLYHWISFYVKIETTFSHNALFLFFHILAKLQSGHRIKLHLLNRWRNIDLRKWLRSFDNRRRCFEQDAGTISSQPSCAANWTTAASSYQQQFHTSDRGPPWDSAVWNRSVQVCH